MDPHQGLGVDRKTFRIDTLGCRTNQYESQAYREQLLQLGWREAASGQAADLCIINTCTVTSQADQSSRSQIRRLTKENPDASIVVTGCAAEKDSEGLLAIGPKLRVIPNRSKETLVEQLFPEELSWPEFKINRFEAHTRAFVKVQDGCNSFCSYCIIPYVRGRSRSREEGAILKEIGDLVTSGYQEVVITGINVGDYQPSLSALIRKVDAIPGLTRVRLSSIDPDEVNRDLIDAILEGRHTCPSLHLVLQSGSDAILKRMNRKYTIRMFTEKVQELLDRYPDFTFTTDVIIGFPGETEEDFEDTLRVLKAVPFAKVHVFPFSPRERTRAALYPPVPPLILQERKQRALRLVEQTSFALRERWLGREVEVLVEGGEMGHTREFLPVHVQAQPNERIWVRLIENRPTGLVGTPL